MIELRCPYCKEDHEIPEDCEYGGEFTAPCGNVVEVEYDEQYDEDANDVWPLYFLWKSKKDRVTLTSTPPTSRSILTEFSKLDPPLELDVEAAARSREKTRALLDSIELTLAQKMLKLQASEFTRDGIMYSDEAIDRIQSQILAQAPPDAPRLDGARTCEIEESSEVVGLPDNGGEK